MSDDQINDTRGQPDHEALASVAPDASGGGHFGLEAHAQCASSAGEEPRGQWSLEAHGRDAPDASGGGRTPLEAHAQCASFAGKETRGQTFHEALASVAPGDDEEDRRFADPLVAEIVQMHRQRRRWMKARNALILQGKAMCRAHLDGDKTAGTAAFNAAAKGACDDPVLIVAIAPFLSSIATFDAELRQIERHLERAAKRLPIWTWAEPIKGLGAASIAAIVGEAGDLSKYRTVSGVWKRLGLAVIDGDGRQRRRADADLAMLHGYAPERRSVIWNVGEAMAKHQREWRDKETGEITKPAGPYGEVLVEAKEAALAKGWIKAHAENHGKRLMTKKMLRDMTVAWRQIAGHFGFEAHFNTARDLPTLMAAE